jgi:iron complex outermembrane receptor protein
MLGYPHGHRPSGAIVRTAMLLAATAAPFCLSLVLAPDAAAQNTAPSATADAVPSQQTADGLEEIVVTARRFLDVDTSGITNLPLPIEKVPQSVSIVNNAFVNAADLRTMADVAQYTTGALWASYSPSYGNQIWLRGFSAGYAIDGLTVGDQITEPDSAILERYQIVKGPASVVYGAQSPGGIVDLVAKSASPNTPNYLEALGGSWGHWRLEGQVAGSLNESGSIRAIGVAAHEEGGSFVDFVKLDKTVVYGGLDFDIADGLTGYVRVSYQRTADTPFNGTPVFADGTLPSVSRSFFVGGSRYEAVAQATRVDEGLSWKPGDLWSFDLKSVYQHTDHGGDNRYNYSTLAPDGSFPIGGEVFKNWYTDDFTIGASTIRKLDDLGLAGSSISANIRYQHYNYSIFENTGGGGTANIFDGDQAVSDIFNAFVPTGSYQQDETLDYLTGATQAVVKLLDPLTLVGGLSYSYPWIENQVSDGPFKNLNPGGQADYRGAVIYEPIKGLNLYYSYSESYQPNLRIDTSYNVLPPVSGRQNEIGAKYLTPSGDLLLSAALFDIHESNVAVYDSFVDGESLYKASGVRHRGLELEGTGRITDRWQIRAGFALLDPTVTEDPTNPKNVGETRPWLPQQTANLFTSYDFGQAFVGDDDFTVGGGMRYVGPVKTYDNASLATAQIPAYIVFDASVGYSIGRYQFQLNLKNMFDEHYFVGTPIFASLAGDLFPGEPRSVTASMRVEF